MGKLGCNLPDTREETGPGTDAGVSGSCDVTGSDVRGPFHIDGAPSRTTLAGTDEPGETMVIEGTLYGPDCETPLAGVMLDVWQADADGDYHGANDDYRLRGQMTTDAQGTYRFETIYPGHYPLGASMRPAHIHFTAIKPGYTPLTTQLYFSGDPYLSPNDPCGTGCNSGDPTLIIDLDESHPDADWHGRFDIILAEA